MQGTALWAQGSAWARARLGWLIKHKWLNVGLRGKMGTLVVAGLLGLLTVFTLLAVSTTRQSADRALNERVTLAQMTASKLDASLRQAARLLSVVAQEPALADPAASPAALVEVLRRGRQAMVGLSEGLWLLDETGQPLASGSLSAPDVNWLALADRDNATQPTFEVLRQPGADPLVIVRVPVHAASGQRVGDLAAVLALSHPDVVPFGRSITLGHAGTVDVVDAAGNILISSHTDHPQLNAHAAAQLQVFLQNGVARVETCRGCYASGTELAADEVIAFAPLRAVPWGVLVRQPAAEVLAPVRVLTVRVLVLGVLTMAGALGLVWVTTSSVIRPLQTLSQAAGRIASGDFTTPIGWQRDDEIGGLAAAFEAMRQRLKRSRDEIEAWNRELDQRVQERTQAAHEARQQAQLARDDLRAVVDALNDELIVVGPEHRLLAMNRTARERRGEAALGQPCYEVHGGQPCPAAGSDCPLGQVLETGRPARVTHSHQEAGGQTRIVDVVASPLRDAQGRVTRVVELARDVTEERRMRAALVRRNQQLAILNTIAGTVNQSLNLGEILERALDEVLRLTSIDAGAIFLLEEELGSLELKACRGLSAEAAEMAAHMGLLDGACGGVLDKKQLVVVPDIERYHGRRAVSLQREAICSLLHVPLVASSRALGSMCVGTRAAHTFDSDELDLLSAIGSQVAVAIDNARLYAEVQRKEFVRGELFKKAIDAQEDERKRIARELHDDTSQALTALLYAVERGLEGDCAEAARADLAGMHQLVQRTLDGVHKVIFDLRPTMLDHLGLVPAVRWLAQSRLEAKAIRVVVEAPAEPPRLPPQVETALFRVVQEAITNVARHSGARNARLVLSFSPGHVSVLAEDDGVGFDVLALDLSPDSQRGLGLIGMRERVELLGGRVSLDTAPGCGTRLQIEVPLDERRQVG